MHGWETVWSTRGGSLTVNHVSVIQSLPFFQDHKSLKGDFTYFFQANSISAEFN